MFLLNKLADQDRLFGLRRSVRDSRTSQTHAEGFPDEHVAAADGPIALTMDSTLDLVWSAQYLLALSFLCVIASSR
jgi:hypothetical protein